MSQTDISEEYPIMQLRIRKLQTYPAINRMLHYVSGIPRYQVYKILSSIHTYAPRRVWNDGRELRTFFKSFHTQEFFTEDSYSLGNKPVNTNKLTANKSPRVFYIARPIADARWRCIYRYLYFSHLREWEKRNEKCSDIKLWYNLCRKNSLFGGIGRTKTHTLTQLLAHSLLAL